MPLVRRMHMPAAQRVPDEPHHSGRTSVVISKLNAKSLKGLAGATGLEPATSGVTGRRSNQLSYAPAGATTPE